MEAVLKTEDENRECGLDISWYALHVRPRSEKLVSQLLEYKGVEEFLPLYREKHRWSDRLAEVELPLFPGYVFCKVDWSHSTPPILTTPGVLSVLGVGGVPAPVDDSELEAIRVILKSGTAPLPWPMPKVGDQIYIEQGPLSGIEGVLIESKNQSRLVVSVTILQRAVAIEIDTTWARPLNPRLRCSAGTHVMSRC